MEIINKELQDYFKNQNVEITLFPEQTTRKFRSLNSFYKYIKTEKEYWEPCSSGNASQIRGHFNTIFNQLDTAIKQNDINQASRYLTQAINSLKINKFPCVYSKSPISVFIKDRFEIHPTQANAACDYFFINNIRNINDVQYFKGIINAFNFSDSEVAATNESESEKKALESLRDEFTKDLDELHNNYLKKKEDVENLFEDYQGKVDKWKDDLQDTTHSYLEEKQDSLDALELLYKEKLRLESPAKYWEDLSNDYENRGKKWRNWIIGSTILTITFLSLLLYKLPNYLFETKNEFSFSSLKGTIIFALIASICIFVIRLFVKLSTSAYHLSRDAYERFQLTHIYLSLLDEKGVEESDRSIVLQSIFSRSDTGLLKGDSSPKIPDGILTQILKNMNH